MTTRTERDLISHLAQHDQMRAHERALAIPDPLFRAQALAWVARYAAERDVVSLAREALAAAAIARDPYHQVAGSAWAIRALVERNAGPSADIAITSALHDADSIVNPVSQVDALFLIWQAAYPLGSAIRHRILTPLLDGATRANSWKPQRVLLSIVFMLAADERALADTIVDRMPEGKYKRAAARRLAAGERQEPRPFFWRSG